MKIIIVNYRYFISGGPERYLFNIKDLLERNGHTVIPFSIKSQHNQPTEYEKFFLSPIGKGKEVYFNEYNKRDIRTVGKAFSRMFYSFEAKKKLDALIKETKPDLIYVLHYQNKLSVSIFDAAVRNKVPVIHRISDFGQICANGLFYRFNKKDICERCLHGSKINAIVNKCVFNSYIYSAVKVASLQLQKTLRLTKKVNAFVVPSKFTITKLQAYGFPAGKTFHIPTFFNFRSARNDLSISYEPFALYVGRVEEEKGIMTLIKAFENSPYNLKIIGASSSGFDKVLKDYLADKDHHIEFLGLMSFEEIQSYLSRCSFTVMPAEWYDNFPNSILESFAFKKCVIASDTGSLKEIVSNNETGFLFPIRDVTLLKTRINELFSDQAKCIELGEKAYRRLNTEFSEDNHYSKLLTLFESVVSKKEQIG